MDTDIWAAHNFLMLCMIFLIKLFGNLKAMSGEMAQSKNCLPRKNKDEFRFLAPG